MSIPVSHYEALLAEVRDLRRKAQRVQELANPLISCYSSSEHSSGVLNQGEENLPISPTVELFLPIEHYHIEKLMNMQSAEATAYSDDDDFVYGISDSASASVSSEPIAHCDRKLNVGSHEAWSSAQTMWNSEPTTGAKFSTAKSLSLQKYEMPEIGSVMSFASSAGGVHIASPSLSRRSSQQLEAKVDMVYSLLAMLSSQEHADMSETLLALSTNPESCLAMRHSGCIPLLVQMVQSDREADVREKAMQALNNLVHSQMSDEKLRKREVRILKLLEQIRRYTELLIANVEYSEKLDVADAYDSDKHPVQTIAHLMKLSFDELHRQAICFLGGIHTIATLVEAEYIKHSNIPTDQNCILLRRYACMALTNLTFGDSGNKALLCSFREFIRALVVQLQSSSDELRQVTASVLRNLSWRADPCSKEVLREMGCVTGLMKAAMLDNKENTLKSILSALWNLSAHCTENKSEICSVNGALGLLVDMLSYKTPSKSLAVIENSGGILRNISSQIAVRDDYREILRQHNCLEVLLAQLKSPSLTIVSNACGTLWNLSAKCQIDQETLWQLGAPAMLRSLNHSKHKMIAMGSSAALKNLLAARPTQSVLPVMDATALAMDLPVLPTLGARKQRALLQDLDQTLSETYENIEKDSPIKSYFTPEYINKAVKKISDFKYNLDEPSTSFNYCERQNFTKNKLKRNLSSASEIDEEYRTVSTHTADSGLQSLDVDHSSLNSIDNDRFKRPELKLKEGSACSDEKDNCSIEDISDLDEQSFLNVDQNKFLLNDEWSFDDLISRKEVFPSSFTSVSRIFPNLKSMNETLLEEGSSNSVNLDEISIKNVFHHNGETTNHFEKHDDEKDKSMECNSRTLNAGSGIPLPRNYSRPIATTPDINNITKSVRSLRRGLPRKCLTSTPIHFTNIKSNLRNNDISLIETSKMQQSIDTVDFNDVASISDVVVATTSMLTDDSLIKDGVVTTCSLPIVENEELEFGPEKAQLNTSDDISSPMTSKNTSPDCLYPNSNSYDFGKDARDHLLERSCEENQPVDNRMLDPDAMIESLDRFTAELVSHASHLQNNKDNTWNDDLSPNEITFPSISGSAPNIITFSDSSEPKQDVEQPDSNNFSSVDTSTMTTSTLIAIEATKMASVFKSEAEMTNSIILDKQENPTTLTTLLASPKLISRKQSLPKAAVLRQTLSNLTHGSSLESLENHSLINLDEVNPPSVMGELFNSITSISSLSCETLDAKPEFVLNEDSNTNQMDISSLLTHQSYLNSFTDLENINPPSILNDITDLCNSLADVCTDAIGSETEIFEDCRTHVLQTEDDITEFSDANSTTPTQSDISSPEASPAKTNSRIMQLKQRRKLGGDRYKTYTLAAAHSFSPESTTPLETFQTCSSTSDLESLKLTLNKKRQMNQPSCETKAVPSSPLLRSKLSIRQSFIQKRLQNRDRFKTHTIQESIFHSKVPADLDLQLLVEREANLVLKSLRETKTGDELLDSETLSLVSNDDDSDRNSASPINYKTYHKGWGLKKNIPVIENSSATVSQPDLIVEDQIEASKPKVVKPTLLNEQPKTIRGRRKPLYFKSQIASSKPATATSAKPTKPKTAAVTSGAKLAAASKNLVKPKPLERQGTFTKAANVSSKNRATTGTSSSSSSTTSKIPSKTRPHSSISSDRSTTKIPHVSYLRSTSADSKEAAAKKRQNLFQSQTVKNTRALPTKKNENNTTASCPMKKQVTSKIASLWKRIEETKVKQQSAGKDTRVWISGNAADANATSDVTLRKRSTSADKDKRISRLGSFIVVDETEDPTAAN